MVTAILPKYSLLHTWGQILKNRKLWHNHIIAYPKITKVPNIKHLFQLLEMLMLVHLLDKIHTWSHDTI